jgi:multiple sugar transport system permease protein
MKKNLKKVPVHVLQAFVVLMFAFPIYWMITTAVKQRGEILTYPPLFVPAHPIVDNFLLFFKATRFGGGIIPMTNSLIAAGLSTIIALVLSIFMAYGFARFKVGGDDLPFFVLTLRMMPPVAAVIPLFFVMKWVNLLDNVFSLVIVYTAFNIPFAVWILRGFFQEIPVEIEESALVDGCSRLRAFLRITLPLAAQGIAVAGIFSFIFSWNEFLFALIFTRSLAKTLPVHLSALHIEQPHGIDWGPMAGTALIASIPVFIAAMIIRRHIVRGLTFGAVKG